MSPIKVTRCQGPLGLSAYSILKFQRIKNNIIIAETLATLREQMPAVMMAFAHIWDHPTSEYDRMEFLQFIHSLGYQNDTLIHAMNELWASFDAVAAAEPLPQMTAIPTANVPCLPDNLMSQPQEMLPKSTEKAESVATTPQPFDDTIQAYPSSTAATAPQLPCFPSSAQALKKATISASNTSATPPPTATENLDPNMGSLSDEELFSIEDLANSDCSSGTVNMLQTPPLSDSSALMPTRPWSASAVQFKTTTDDQNLADKLSYLYGSSTATASSSLIFAPNTPLSPQNFDLRALKEAHDRENSQDIQFDLDMDDDSIETPPKRDTACSWFSKNKAADVVKRPTSAPAAITEEAERMYTSESDSDGVYYQYYHNAWHVVGEDDTAAAAAAVASPSPPPTPPSTAAAPAMTAVSECEAFIKNMDAQFFYGRDALPSANVTLRNLISFPPPVDDASVAKRACKSLKRKCTRAAKVFGRCFGWR